jgi:hypothetical protein
MDKTNGFYQYYWLKFHRTDTTTLN